jgi:D-apiose dehydrogenase
VSVRPRRPGPLRAAVIGAGSIATHHIVAWREIPDVEIVAVADIDHAKAREFASRHGIDPAHAYGDAATVIDAEELDFVDIASAPDAHAGQVELAARHGLHVLCQKPFVGSMDEARRLIDLCAAQGVRCVVNENWRWRPWYRRIKALIDAGTIGDVRYAAFTCHRDLVLPRPDGELPDLLRRQPYTADMERLLLFEWGIHLLDVMRFLVGPITTVEAAMDRVSPLVRGEDKAVINLGFGSGAVGLVDISWGSRIRDDRRLIRGNVEPFVVEGDRGTIELDPHVGDILYVTTEVGTRTEEARGGLSHADAYQDSFTACQRHFVDSLRGGGPAENDADDNLNALAATFASYESARSGGRVTL